MKCQQESENLEPDPSIGSKGQLGRVKFKIVKTRLERDKQ